MARQFYSLEERFRIRTNTMAARKHGMKWKQAHEIAKEAGYRGGLPALKIFIKKAKPLNPARNALTPTPTIKPRKPRKIKRVKAVETTNPRGDLESAIDRMVHERVHAALEMAIDVLKSAM